jgi:hypothetical protein
VLEEMKKDMKKSAQVVRVQDIKKISTLAQRQIDIEEKIEKAENVLSSLKQQLDEVQLRLLPDALAEAGVSTIRLETGETVEVKKIYASNLTEKNKEACFTWLRSNGHAALVSHEIVVKFRKGEDKTHDLVSGFLKENTVDHSDADKVHPQTLQAFIREQVEGGADFPLDLFQVSIINKAKVK